MHATTHPTEFDLEVVPYRQQVIVAVTGEIDIATVNEVRDSIFELRVSGWQRIVLDLREVEFMDSQGVHLLLDCDADARRGSWEFFIADASPAVARLLEVAAPDAFRRLDQFGTGVRFVR